MRKPNPATLKMLTLRRINSEMEHVINYARKELAKSCHNCVVSKETAIYHIIEEYRKLKGL